MILVTGFAPYRDDLNASGALVASMQDELPFELHWLEDRLCLDVIECDDSSRESEHRSLEHHLAMLLERHQPKLCIFTGQAPHHNKIKVEKIAINSFMCQIINPQRPVAYWADLPGIDEIPAVLGQHGIPAQHSYYAGQHLCNHILFSSLYFTQTQGLPRRSGFVHIPVLPEQVHKRFHDSAYMPMEISKKALTIVINHVAQAAHRQWES